MNRESWKYNYVNPRKKELSRDKVILQSRQVWRHVKATDEINVPETVLRQGESIAIRGKRLLLKLPVLASNMTFQ